MKRCILTMVMLIGLIASAVAADPASLTATAKCVRALTQEDPELARIDVTKEHFERAYTERDGERFYYGMKLSKFDREMEGFEEGDVKLPVGVNLTGRDYRNYLKRLGLRDEDVRRARGESWLSVGEGTSNFTHNIRDQGINGIAVDAAVINPYSPETSILAYAQDLPFADEVFDRTNSVWLIQHFFRPSGGSSMFNPTAGRKAILELIRVTKKGGQIRINPLLGDAAPILDFLAYLKTLGLIDYQTNPQIRMQVSDGEKRLENVGQYTSVVITRNGIFSTQRSGSSVVPADTARSEMLVRYGFFSREAVSVKRGEVTLEFGDDPRFVNELRANGIDARLYDYERDGSTFDTGFPDQSIDRIFNLSGGVDKWDGGSLDSILGEVFRVLKPGGRVDMSSIKWPSLEAGLLKYPKLEVTRRYPRPRTGEFYVELRRKP